jgi:hypothetical protein
MSCWLVETYLAREAATERVAREQRARSAVEELTQKAEHIRFDRSIHVLEDEICFFVFDAPSSHVVALVAERARLDALRIVEAVSSGKEKT